MKKADMPAMPNQVNGGDIHGGLTKREYFAGLAMQGLLANSSLRLPSVAGAAVKYADALLEELSK